MGTSKGNYGRKMYSNPEWKKKISESNTLKKIEVGKTCPKCGIVFIVVRRINKNGTENIPKKERQYCNRSCANSRTHSEETKEKIRKANSLGRIINYCKDCNKKLDYRNETGYCVKCRSKNKFNEAFGLNKIKLKQYRQHCIFNFNLATYPNEFNFTLIEEYGWYRAKNHGDNPKGVSRDHIVSVKYGFDNNINPEIISHPANCQLMQHNKNISKNTKCDITYEELLEKIEVWNKKYMGL